MLGSICNIVLDLEEHWEQFGLCFQLGKLERPFGQIWGGKKTLKNIYISPSEIEDKAYT